MRTIIVDDDKNAVDFFKNESERVFEIELIGAFTSALPALEFAKENEVDFALLDVDMPEMDGFELCDSLRSINPKIVIVFVTAHSGYAVEAIRKKADYIMFKPYNHDDLADATERAVMLKTRQDKRISFQTFGSFSMFVDGVPFKFSSAKSRELLAFLIAHNGRSVTASEIIFSLWEDFNGSVKECSYYRITIKRLIDDLKKINAENIIVRDSKMCMINRKLVDCDYFKFMDGSREYLLKYDYDFLTDYSWAEDYIYRMLDFKKERLKKY